MEIFYLDVAGTTGSAAATVTASPSTGCVMEKMTAWTGVMRSNVSRKFLLLSSLWPALVLALTTG